MYLSPKLGWRLDPSREWDLIYLHSGIFVLHLCPSHSVPRHSVDVYHINEQMHEWGMNRFTFPVMTGKNGHRIFSIQQLQHIWMYGSTVKGRRTRVFTSSYQRAPSAYGRKPFTDLFKEFPCWKRAKEKTALAPTHDPPNGDQRYLFEHLSIYNERCISCKPNPHRGSGARNRCSRCLNDQQSQCFNREIPGAISFPHASLQTVLS